MDERTPAPGESFSSPTARSTGSAGYGEQDYSNPESEPSFGERGRREARRLGGAARRRLIAESDRRKGDLASRLEQLADTLEEAGKSGGPEGRLLDTTADFARRASSRLDDRSSGEFLDTLEQGFRDHPGLALAGCAALGFIGGRLLRS